MTHINTIIEEEKEEAHKYWNKEAQNTEQKWLTPDTWGIIYEIITTAMQRAYEAGYKLAVEHLKEAYAHNGTTTVPEAIEWLEDNSKYQDKK